MRNLLFFLVPSVVAIPFDAEANFPYGPFGVRPMEHHFINPAELKKVRMASARSEPEQVDKDSEDHFPYKPLGARPYEHHFVEPKQVKKVKLASTDSMTDVPSADDFKEAKEALFHAVEKVEKSLLNAARKVEQAAEHAIEDEVDVLFHEREKGEADETAKKEPRGGKKG